MNKIRAAVVGAGIYGKHHMNAYRHNPDTVLVAICDTDTERCDDLAMSYGIMGYTRLETLLEEYSAAIFLIPICISFDTAEKRRYATYLILNRRFSFEF